MSDKELNDSPNILRFLPSISELLQTGTARKIETEFGVNYLTTIARTAVEYLRSQLTENEPDENLSREESVNTS